MWAKHTLRRGPPTNSAQFVHLGKWSATAAPPPTGAALVSAKYDCYTNSTKGARPIGRRGGGGSWAPAGRRQQVDSASFPPSREPCAGCLLHCSRYAQRFGAIVKSREARRYAGQNEAYLIAQLQAFKAGDRKNEMMSVVIQDLSDADIENLAAYYSAIEISVSKPPAR